MSSPVVYGYPIKRPGFITSAEWINDDAHLAMHITYIDVGNVQRSMNFETRNLSDAVKGEICLPSSTDLNNLGTRARDILAAHTRMACMIKGLAVPGSKEFDDAFIQNDTNFLQTSLGTVKVTAVNPIDDQNIEITYKQGTGPAFTITVDHTEFNNYVFVPDTQLLIVPGAVKKQYPNYVHDYPNSVLTQAQKDAVAAYILGLEPWI